MRDGKPVYLDAMIKKVDRYKDLFKARMAVSPSPAANP